MLDLQLFFTKGKETFESYLINTGLVLLLFAISKFSLDKLVYHHTKCIGT